MISFKRLTSEDREEYLRHMAASGERGCEYSFVNLNIWGRQRVAFQDGFMLLFSQFDRFTIYPFPQGQGDLKAALDALMEDARKRGIPCRLSSMTQQECGILESLYPGRFHFHTDRDNYDYVYRIEDLAFLRGKRYQSKRNFANRFRANYPDCRILPLDDTTAPAACKMLQQWFADRKKQDPLADFHLEQIALDRALPQREMLGLEGLVIMDGDRCIAMTMGSRLSENTFDIHFEKALDGYDGAYAAINQNFAQYLMEKYPEVEFLNREDDMGIPGLRKAKLSYHPDHLVEKHWARLWEDDDEH